ncbi:hypothetical protein [Acidithiobacillus concretivorus]|uniref:Uncharacterized protein n=1 Tax=Acidithiobacillus concretivorus TaxID=3063952 RepID=A0ABS5ZSA6_9PROT|nr:hypothetical protein [Acidithiobacillus concretivorus]MBU2739531.1 hypothetical protein [Acidithiobacillus concretivorus]
MKVDRCDAQDAQLQTEALKPYAMSSAEIRNNTAALPQNFQKTCRALTAYLDGKRQTR